VRPRRSQADHGCPLWPTGGLFVTGPPHGAVRPDVETSSPAVSPNCPSRLAEQRGLAASRKNLASENKTLDLSAVSPHDASETHDYATAAAAFTVFGEHSAMQTTSVVRRCRVESQINQKIKRVLHTTPGLTTKQIADRIGASHSHTAHALRRLRLHLGEARIEGRPHRYYPVMIATDLKDVGYGDKIEEQRAPRRRRAARVARQRRG
jgi:hypothetical protein